MDLVRTAWIVSWACLILGLPSLLVLLVLLGRRDILGPVLDGRLRLVLRLVLGLLRRLLVLGGILGLLLGRLVVLRLLRASVVRTRGVLVQGDPVPPFGQLPLLLALALSLACSAAASLKGAISSAHSCTCRHVLVQQAQLC